MLGYWEKDLTTNIILGHWFMKMGSKLRDIEQTAMYPLKIILDKKWIFTKSIINEIEVKGTTINLHVTTII